MTRRFGNRHDVIDLHRLCAILSGQPGPSVWLHFFRVPKHNIHFGHLRKGLRLGLRSATGYDQLGLRVCATQLAYVLLGFAHRLRSHSAGIHHHRISEARLTCQLFHRLGFIHVQPAAMI